jgi:AcrR family transcriptional regulator
LTVRQNLSYRLIVPLLVERSPGRSPEQSPGPSAESPLSGADRVLEAAKRCCERWGMAKVTVDDIAAEAGMSRATLYRLFPGGKDVLYEALRRRDSAEFFTELQAHVDAADSLEDLLVRMVVEATRQLRTDEHLQVMLASRPGEVAMTLNFDGLPVIFETATAYLTPLVARWIGEERAAELAELLSRLVVSYFLTPSRFVDFGEPESASRFIHNHVLPAFPVHTPSP